MAKVGEEFFEFTLTDYLSGTDFAFTAGNTELAGKTIILSFIDIVSPKSWHWLKSLEAGISGATDLIKVFVIYNPASVQDLNWPSVPPPPFPANYGPTIDPGWIGAKRIHYGLGSYPGSDSHWIYIPDVAGLPSPTNAVSEYPGALASFVAPGIFVIRPSDRKLTDAMHFGSADNGTGAFGGGWTDKDLVDLDWGAVPDPAAPGTLPEGMTLAEYNTMDKILRYVDKRRRDIMNASRIVQVSSPSSTNGKPWVTNGTTLAFRFCSKDGSSYIPKKAVGAGVAENYLLGAESGHFESLSPARITASDYLNEMGAAETRSVTLGPSIAADHAGQSVSFSPSGTNILDTGGQPFSFEGVAPVFEVLDKDPTVYFRDNLETDFGFPHNGNISSSPDVILKNSIAANPDADLGDSTANSYALSDDAMSGRDNYLYLRAYNRGADAAPANSIRGTVYWAEPSTLITPSSWHLIGSTDWDVSIEGGRAHLRVAPRILWQAAQVSPIGHHCFVATIVPVSDGAAGPETYKNALAAQMHTIEDYYNVIRTERRVTWKNYNVVPASSPMPKPPYQVADPLPNHRHLGFGFPGLPGKNPEFKLEVIHRLPAGQSVKIELPDEMLGLMRSAWKDLPHEKIKAGARFQAQPNQIIQFPNMHELASLKAPPKIWLQVPRLPKDLKGMYTIVARQLWNGKEVGRVTWVFIPAHGGLFPEYHPMHRWQEEVLMKMKRGE